MKVNAKILHIPPYISTSWNFVRALYLKGPTLVIVLLTGVELEVPDLKSDVLESIFSAHSSYLEGEKILPDNPPSQVQMTLAKRPPFLTESKRCESETEAPLIFGLGAFDSLGSVLHHNSNQANMPDLPAEVLQKISAIAKIVSPEDVQSLPKAEPHCNCAHCQITRAVKRGLDNAENPPLAPNHEIPEEEVTDADLCFQQWEIVQTGDKLYSCTNRLDSKEVYSIYLGNPVGCTCGKEGCEHIHAVLKS